MISKRVPKELKIEAQSKNRKMLFGYFIYNVSAMLGIPIRTSFLMNYRDYF